MPFGYFVKKILVQTVYLCAISTNVRCSSRFCDTVYSCTILTNCHCHLFILTTPITCTCTCIYMYTCIYKLFIFLHKYMYIKLGYILHKYFGRQNFIYMYIFIVPIGMYAKEHNFVRKYIFCTDSLSYPTSFIIPIIDRLTIYLYVKF